MLRGDIERISVAAETSIQDGVVIHTEPGAPVVIGRGCAVGHGAIVHGAVIGDGSLIGMHATLLDGAEIGEQSIVGANALVLGRRAYPRRSLLIGTPAKVVRELTDEDIERITWRARPLHRARQACTPSRGLPRTSRRSAASRAARPPTPSAVATASSRGRGAVLDE